MAQVQAFETDFWKDANLRKVWDEIVPGEPRKTIPYRLTSEAIELYCRAGHPCTSDWNISAACPCRRACRFPRRSARCGTVRSRRRR